MRRHLIRVLFALVVALGLALPAAAQTGGIRGKVVDQKGQPVEGAKIVLESSGRKRELTSNKKGEFIQIGLTGGQYTVTVTKEGVGTRTQELRIGIGEPVSLTIELSPTAGMSDADKKRVETLHAALQSGEALVKENKNDEAIAKFNEAVAILPNCHVCFFYIGVANQQKKELTAAEEAYKKATSIKPDFIEGYNALANLYNAQKRFDEALAVSQKAAELGGAIGGPGGAAGASAVYNQGVMLWNQQKFAEAKEQFAKAVQIDPKMAEAWYQLGMANLNTGDMKGAADAFEGYLKAAPTGPKAEEVKGILSQLKK
jgi:tetratricopeptide (TPR) repeat protein